MRLISKTLQIFGAISALFVLSACSSGPSEGDIKAAIEHQVQSQLKVVQQFTGVKPKDMDKDLMPQVKSVKKIGCKEDGNNAFKCDVEVEVAYMGSTNKAVRPMRFVKTSDGWQASE